MIQMKMILRQLLNKNFDDDGVTKNAIDDVEEDFNVDSHVSKDDQHDNTKYGNNDDEEENSTPTLEDMFD